jgi:hypothetical protein
MHATNSDTLLETLIARTIGDESGLSMSALLAAPVPAGILRYLHAEIINTLADDLTRAPHFARAASPTAGPDTIRDALLAHAAGQYIFPREEFLEMLENAARFTENYLCRPRWTLASFLFVDQPAITTETLLRKLEYITDYAYLPQLVRRMVTRSGKQVISSNECIAMIARIDDAILREHTPRELALLAKPIYEFFLLSGDVESKPIDLRALLLFLDDKQLGKFREYVEGVWHMRGNDGITLQEFVDLSEDFASGRPAAVPEPAILATPAEAQPEPAALEPAVPGPAQEAPEPTSEAHPELVAEPLPPESPAELPPTWEAPPVEIPPHGEPIQESLPFMSEPPLQPADTGVEQPGPTPEVTPEEEPGGPEQPTEESLQQEMPAADGGSQEAAPSPPVLEIPASPTLTEIIPADLRRRFINVICGKDAEFYDLVIARLDEMHSWAEASAYVRELFEINTIDPFNETAIAFTDIVQKRCDRPGAA